MTQQDFITKLKNIKNIYSKTIKNNDLTFKQLFNIINSLDIDIDELSIFEIDILQYKYQLEYYTMQAKISGWLDAYYNIFARVY